MPFADLACLVFSMWDFSKNREICQGVFCWSILLDVFCWNLFCWSREAQAVGDRNSPRRHENGKTRNEAGDASFTRPVAPSESKKPLVSYFFRVLVVSYSGIREKPKLRDRNASERHGTPPERSVLKAQHEPGLLLSLPVR